MAGNTTQKKQGHTKVITWACGHREKVYGDTPEDLKRRVELFKREVCTECEWHAKYDGYDWDNYSDTDDDWE